jgi:type II secretory pathway pseudopilin PulG
VLLATTIVCILAGISVPSLLATVDRSRGVAAARYLVARMALARSQAVGRAAVVALYFEQDARGFWFSVIQDGNGNGVRTYDIQLQVDRVIEAPVLLSDLFPGVAIGLAPQTPGTQPVQLGGTSILSFTPMGTSTSGSVYVRGRDGTQWAVRVLGVTARARLLRYTPATGNWVNAD